MTNKVPKPISTPPDSKSVTEKEAQIHVLEVDIVRYNTSLTRWNNAYLGLLAVTVLAGAGTLVTTRGIVTEGARVSSDEASITHLKEAIDGERRQAFITDLADKEQRIAEAQEAAGKANKAAESEKLARIRLAARIAPRTLSLEQQAKIGEACSGITGSPIVILSYSLDPEASALARQIMESLRSSGFSPISRIGGAIASGEPDTGVVVRSPASEIRFAECLAHALKNIGGLDASVNSATRIDPESLLMAYMSMGGADDVVHPAAPLKPNDPILIVVGTKPWPLLTDIK